MPPRGIGERTVEQIRETARDEGRACGMAHCSCPAVMGSVAGQKLPLLVLLI